jgi:hypothetical protein
VSRRFQFEVIENGLCVSLDIAVGRRRLYEEIGNSTVHVQLKVVLDETSNFRQIDVAGLEIEIKRGYTRERIALRTQHEVAICHHSRGAPGRRHQGRRQLDAIR